MVKFVSFEETLCVLAALATAAATFKLFHATILTSAFMGGLAAAIVAYTTFFEFTLANDVISYRSRFHETEFPLLCKECWYEYFLGRLARTHVYVRHAEAPSAYERIFRADWTCIVAERCSLG